MQEANEPSYQPALVKPLPNRRFLIIEYPGNIKDVNRALNTLGGEQSLLKVCQELSKHTELRFRPDNPYCHPVYGDHVKTNNFLLRVTTNDSNNNNNNNNHNVNNVNNDNNQEDNAKINTAEIIGVISNAISFKGMADFQYAPDTSQWKNKEGLTGKLAALLSKVTPKFSLVDFVAEVDANPDQTIHLPPPIFSRIDTPSTQYSFRPRSSNAPLANVELPVVYFDPNQPEVPQGPKFSEEKPPPLPSFVTSEVFEKLKQLFEKRPIWSQLALCGELKLQSPKVVLKACPYVSYYMNSGSWRKCWIRFGYDPRKDPHSAMYQIIDLRLALNELGQDEKIDTSKPLDAKTPRRYKGTNTSSKQSIPDHTFSSPPVHLQTLYQICDINDISVQRTALQATRKSSCDHLNGWLSQMCISKIREIMKARLDLMRANLKKGRENTQNTSESSGEKISDQSTTTENTNTNTNTPETSNAMDNNNNSDMEKEYMIDENEVDEFSSENEENGDDEEPFDYEEDEENQFLT